MGVSTTKCEIVCIRLLGMCDVFFLARETPFWYEKHLILILRAYDFLVRETSFLYFKAGDHTALYSHFGFSADTSCLILSL